MLSVSGCTPPIVGGLFALWWHSLLDIYHLSGMTEAVGQRIHKQCERDHRGTVPACCIRRGHQQPRCRPRSRQTLARVRGRCHRRARRQRPRRCRLCWVPSLAVRAFGRWVWGPWADVGAQAGLQGCGLQTMLALWLEGGNSNGMGRPPKWQAEATLTLSAACRSTSKVAGGSYGSSILPLYAHAANTKTQPCDYSMHVKLEHVRQPRRGSKLCLMALPTRCHS